MRRRDPLHSLQLLELDFSSKWRPPEAELHTHTDRNSTQQPSATVCPVTVCCSPSIQTRLIPKIGMIVGEAALQQSAMEPAAQRCSFSLIFSCLKIAPGVAADVIAGGCVQDGVVRCCLASPAGGPHSIFLPNSRAPPSRAAASLAQEDVAARSHRAARVHSHLQPRARCS